MLDSTLQRARPLVESMRRSQLPFMGNSRPLRFLRKVVRKAFQHPHTKRALDYFAVARIRIRTTVHPYHLPL